MSESNPLVRVHVNIEISAATLQAVVANSKKKVGVDEKGHYHLDTADALAALISRFLHEKEFEQFVGNIDNY